MNTYEPISVAAAKALIESRPVQLVDIRDVRAFTEAHIEASINIDNDSLGPFLAQADPQAPLIVCCYHGISSRNAAQFFADQGFSEVYSLEGGFEAWRSSL